MPRGRFSSWKEADWIASGPCRERYEHYWQRLASLYAEADERRLLRESRNDRRGGVVDGIVPV